MRLSFHDAAARTGARPSTIFRAILSGRLGCERDDQGSYLFDQEELEKVFPRARRVAPAPLARAFRDLPAFTAGTEHQSASVARS